jgi:hypothetical protein
VGFAHTEMYFISPVRTARKATWAAHAFAHFIEADRDTALPRFRFFRVENKADPLVAGKRRTLTPHRIDCLVGADGRFEVQWERMYRAYGGLPASISSHI